MQYWTKKKANRKVILSVGLGFVVLLATVFFLLDQHAPHLFQGYILAVLVLCTGVLFLAISAQKLLAARKTTHQLRRQQRLLATTFSTLREAVLITDADGDIVYISPAAEQLTGWTTGAAFGKSVVQVCPLESAQKRSLWSVFNHVISNSTRVELEDGWALRIQDGRDISVEGTICPVMDEDGAINRIVVTLVDTTAKKTADRKAFQREQLMRELIETIPAAVYTCDEFGYIQLYNRAATKIWGREPVNGHEQWIGAWRLFDENGEPVYGEESPMAQTIQRRTAVTGSPLTLQRPDGSRRKIQAHPKPLFDEKQRLYGAVNLLEDITDREAQQLMMRQTQEKYKFFIEQATDGVLLYSMDGTIFEFNPAAYRLTGYSHEEFSKLRLQDILVGDVVVNPGNVQRMMAGEAVLFTRQIRSKEGVLKEVEINARMLPDHTFLAFVRDVTERMQAELELRASEERYRHLFNNNRSSIYIWDIDTLSILEVNETTCEKYGYTAEELKQMNLLDLRSPDEHAAILDFVANVRKDPSFRQDDVWKHRTSAGDEMFMHIMSHQIEFQGKPARMSVAKDITESIQLKAQLEKERIQKQYQITDAVISAQEHERQYIGRELHDNINQVLASARLYLGLAKKDAVKNHSFLEEADNMVNTAIDDIRSVSHALIPPSISENALQDAVEILLDRIKSTTPLKLKSDLSGIAEARLSSKLKLNIYRIVQEQLNNIVKYAVASEVLISLRQEGESLLLLIKDNGIGFDTAVKTAGVGLLNIRTRASLFNGELEISAAPGEGCTLRVRFGSGFSG